MQFNYEFVSCHPIKDSHIGGLGLRVLGSGLKLMSVMTFSVILNLILRPLPTVQEGFGKPDNPEVVLLTFCFSKATPVTPGPGGHVTYEGPKILAY